MTEREILKKRPLGITIVAIVFFLSAIYYIFNIDHPFLFAGFVLSGMKAILCNALNILVMLFIGIGFLNLSLVAWRAFIVYMAIVLAIGLINIIIFLSLYSAEERMMMQGYNLSEGYKISDNFISLASVIPLVFSIIVFIYVLKKRKAFI